MAAKIKGIYKGFKSISQIFAAGKEAQLEIGYPTDVKHVAHIGSDGSIGNAPSWMSEFKGGSESFSPRQSFATARQSNSSSLSLEFDNQTVGQQQSMAEMLRVQPTDLPNIPKKQRHKKKQSNSSRKSSDSSRKSSSKCSSTSSRSAMSKSTYNSAKSVLT